MNTDQSEHRLAEIRRQIALGTYETPEKLEAAVERLLQRVTREESPQAEAAPRPK